MRTAEANPVDQPSNFPGADRVPFQAGPASQDSVKLTNRIRRDRRVSRDRTWYTLCCMPDTHRSVKAGQPLICLRKSVRDRKTVSAPRRVVGVQLDRLKASPGEPSILPSNLTAARNPHASLALPLLASLINAKAPVTGCNLPRVSYKCRCTLDDSSHSL